jgi:hypothetical protein
MNSESFPSSPLAWALAYAALGWRVSPARNNDDHHPHLTGWQTKATTDAEQIRVWWDYWPLATPSLALDAPHVVVDLDVKYDLDGTATFKRLTGLSPLDYETPIAQTPSCGLHLHFLCDLPLRNSVAKVGKGIDIRVAGSTVPLPSGRNARKWIKPPRVRLAPLPAVISERAMAEAERTSQTPPAPAADFQGHIRREVLCLLKAACRNIAYTAPGAQETTLHRCCFTIGGLIAAGELPYDQTVAALIDAGSQMHDGDPSRPWTAYQIEQKVAGSIRRGMERPWKFQTNAELSAEFEEYQRRADDPANLAAYEAWVAEQLRKEGQANG